MFYCVKYHCFTSDNPNSKWYERNGCCRCFSNTSFVISILTAIIGTILLLTYPMGLLMQLILGFKIKYDIMYNMAAGSTAGLMILFGIAGLAGVLFILAFLIYCIGSIISGCVNLYDVSERERQRLLLRIDVTVGVNTSTSSNIIQETSDTPGRDSTPGNDNILSDNTPGSIV